MSVDIQSAVGVKLASLLAGFAGAVVSLSFVKRLSRGYMLTSVIVGTISAGYLTPLGLAYFHLPAEIQNGLAFIVGLTAMNIVPGILRLSDWFRRDPSLSITGVNKPGDK